MQTVKPRAKWSRILQTWKIEFPDKPGETWTHTGAVPGYQVALRAALHARVSQQIGLQWGAYVGRDYLHPSANVL
jgi:hypothetical protein